MREAVVRFRETNLSTMDATFMTHSIEITIYRLSVSTSLFDCPQRRRNGNWFFNNSNCIWKSLKYQQNCLDRNDIERTSKSWCWFSFTQMLYWSSVTAILSISWLMLNKDDVLDASDWKLNRTKNMIKTSLAARLEQNNSADHKNVQRQTRFRWRVFKRI